MLTRSNSIFCLDQYPASNAPEMLCQTLKMAPGSALSGVKYFMASATAKPEFCIPTSMAIVLQIA